MCFYYREGPETHVNAIDLVGKMGAPALCFVPTLSECLQSDIPSVRSSAAWALLVKNWEYIFW